MKVQRVNCQIDQEISKESQRDQEEGEEEEEEGGWGGEEKTGREVNRQKRRKISWVPVKSRRLRENLGFKMERFKKGSKFISGKRNER